ncbi:MAG: TRAP transporter small permease subunit, partial [Mailhella sp.]|nr:TRAP transporter small permease subunit [Mailhella sp.]
RRKHIAVDLLVSRLHGVARRTVDIAANLLSLCALSLLLFGGWRIVELTYDINSVATNVNMAIINCTLPIMAFATIVLTLKDLVRLLKAPVSSGAGLTRAEGAEE